MLTQSDQHTDQKNSGGGWVSSKFPTDVIHGFSDRSFSRINRTSRTEVRVPRADQEQHEIQQFYGNLEENFPLLRVLPGPRPPQDLFQ